MLQLQELKPLVTLPQWDLFEQHIENREKILLDFLVTAKNVDEMHELKGKIKILRELKALKSAVKSS